MIKMLLEVFRRQMESTIHEHWIPRVGDRIEFVAQAKTQHFKYDAYDPVSGDKGVIVSIYKNYWGYDGYIIALDNGYQVDYEFPRKRYMRLLEVSYPRKAVLE